MKKWKIDKLLTRPKTKAKQIFLLPKLIFLSDLIAYYLPKRRLLNTLLAPSLVTKLIVCVDYSLVTHVINLHCLTRVSSDSKLSTQVIYSM